MFFTCDRGSENSTTAVGSCMRKHEHCGRELSWAKLSNLFPRRKQREGVAVRNLLQLLLRLYLLHEQRSAGNSPFQLAHRFLDMFVNLGLDVAIRLLDEIASFVCAEPGH